MFCDIPTPLSYSRSSATAIVVHVLFYVLLLCGKIKAEAYVAKAKAQRNAELRKEIVKNGINFVRLVY